MSDPHGHLVRVTDAHTNPRVSSFPRYDRRTRDAGIVHIGVGNFHRAHQARVLDDYLQHHDGDWMIHGIGCLASDLKTLNDLRIQDHLYSLIERTGSSDALRIIGSIKQTTHAPTQYHEAIEAIARPETRIISLTITEGGYCTDHEGNLDLTHPLIASELAGGESRTALGLLVDGLRARMYAHSTPVTVLSCDNLIGNGDTTKRVVGQYAAQLDPAFAAWLEESVTFPNSMVDRITPASSESTVDLAAFEFGVDDCAPVASESYIRWVIEDNFAHGRPDLEAVGVTFVTDARPYEQLNVRLLNGSHTAMAYVASLMGIRTVSEAVRNPTIREFLIHFMDADVTPTLPAVPEVNIASYKRELLVRLSNPAISDPVERIAMDGSHKVANAIVPVLEHQLRNGGSIRYTAFAIAAWYRYLRGIDDRFQAVTIIDPMADDLCALAETWPRLPHLLLGVRDIFGSELARYPELREALSEALTAIDRSGTRRALTSLLYDMTASNPRPAGTWGLG